MLHFNARHAATTEMGHVPGRDGAIATAIISVPTTVRPRAIKAFGLATASLYQRLSTDGGLGFGIL